MNYTVEYQKNSMPLTDFRQKYQNREKYMAYCRACTNYNMVWSCPPLSFDVEEYLAEFGWIHVLCARIVLSSHVIAEADTPEKIKAMGGKILSEVKRNMEEKLRSVEKRIPESISLSSGGCHLCKECSRRDGQPCRQPRKMRYSLDAFGFDLSAIAKDMFAIDILWCKDRLPDYFTLVHGLLTKDEKSAALIIMDL